MQRTAKEICTCIYRDFTAMNNQSILLFDQGKSLAVYHLILEWSGVFTVAPNKSESALLSLRQAPTLVDQT